MNVWTAWRYRIRRMRSQDIRRVAALEKRVFRDPWPERAYIQELYFNPTAYYFVLQVQALKEEGGGLWRRWKQKRSPVQEIHGFAGVRLESKRAHISTLAVHPHWRGQGFGELLLITLLEKALREGAERVTLEVRVSNAVAQALYRKYTFHKVAHLPAYYKDGEDAALLESDPAAEGYERRLRERRQAVERRLWERGGRRW
ncbi:MAG: ribosomal protein S18-alanine N-acetyltransferase [Anaerolineae bacterium]